MYVLKVEGLVIRGLSTLIAASNIWFAFLAVDKDKYNDAGLDFVTVSNLMLLGGILMDYHVLIAIWIAVYIFAILIAASQFAMQGHWLAFQLPGLSTSVAKLVTVTLNLKSSAMTAIAILIDLFCVLTVSAYLLINIYTQVVSRRNVLPVTQADFDDGLPTYSEAANVSDPPPYTIEKS